MLARILKGLGTISWMLAHILDILASTLKALADVLVGLACILR